VEHEVALFHRLTTYPACVQPGIRGSPGHLGQYEMYKQSLELVRSLTPEPVRRALERFDKEIGTGRASVDLQEIATAACTGRVEHLFIYENAAVPSAALLNTAVVETLRRGGNVEVLSETGMVSGRPIWATLRYVSDSPR